MDETQIGVMMTYWSDKCTKLHDQTCIQVRTSHAPFCAKTGAALVC